MFSGITLRLKPVEYIEPSQGFKGITVRVDRRQYIEPSTGFKGITIITPYSGQVIITKIYSR